MSDDHNLIASTWLKGARYGNDFFKAVDSKVYYEEYSQVLTAKLSVGSIIIVCLAEDPEVIIGYVAYRPGIIDWLYVKTAFRSQGIARSMLTALAFEYKELVATGYSKAGAAICKSKNIPINPFL
jgi:hypothetical protein